MKSWRKAVVGTQATVGEAIAAIESGSIQVALVLDAGPCEGVSSTVVDSTGEVPKLLRAGSVAWEQIVEVTSAR